jgi:hypothetical protein
MRSVVRGAERGQARKGGRNRKSESVPDPFVLAGTITQTGHEMLLAIELGQDGADLGAREDHGQPSRPPGPAGVDSPLQGSLEDDFVEEQQGAHRLVLGRGGDILIDCQMSQEGLDFASPHLQWMPLAMEHDESFGPVNIGILGTDAIMQQSSRLPYAIEQLGPRIGG